MRSKLNYLIGVSLKRKTKTKWFMIANLLLAIAIVGVINVDSIIRFFGGDFNEKQEIYVVDHTNLAYDIFKSQMETNESALDKDKKESDYIVSPYKKNMDEIEAFIKEKKKKRMVVIFEPNEKNVLSAKVVSEGFIDTIPYQLISNAINNTKVALAIHASDISMEEINKIYTPIEIEREILDETKKTEDENMEMIMSMVFPAFILPFFMLTIFLVQMIGAEVNDEKTTRGMEIIISNVSPKTHFFAKVISSNLFVLIQGGLLVLFGTLGLFVRNAIGGDSIVGGLGTSINDMLGQIMKSELGSELVYIIPLALTLMLLTFLAYSVLAGVLASMTTNTEDFQQLQTPIIIISLVGYFLAIMAGAFKGALFIRVLSYVPFISAILSPSLLVMNQIGVSDVIISIIIMIATNYFLIKYGLRIYKVGILNYSTTGLWKKMAKALKNKA